MPDGRRAKGDGKHSPADADHIVAAVTKGRGKGWHNQGRLVQVLHLICSVSDQWACVCHASHV